MNVTTRVVGAVIAGAAALVIGTQVAGAQESPSPSAPPSTESPAPDGTQSPDSDDQGRRGRGNREDCPDKDKDKDGVPDDAPGTEGSGAGVDATSI